MKYIVGTFKVRQRGPRGFEVTLSKSWIEQNKLKYGDDIEFSIDTDDPAKLILTPKA